MLNLKDTIQVNVTIQIIYGKILAKVFTGQMVYVLKFHFIDNNV